MPDAIVICPNCGSSYMVTPEDLNSVDLIYYCEDCGNEYEIEFIDYCPECGGNIGFEFVGTDDQESISLYAKTISEGFTNPLKTLTRALTATNSNGFGRCPCCDNWYIRCSQCNELTEVPIGTKTGEFYECKKCGKSLQAFPFPEYGNKHSRRFYKHKINR